MPILRFKDVIDQFDHVDDPDVLEKAKTNAALRHAPRASLMRLMRSGRSERLATHMRRGKTTRSEISLIGGPPRLFAMKHGGVL